MASFTCISRMYIVQSWWNRVNVKCFLLGSKAGLLLLFAKAARGLGFGFGLRGLLIGGL